MRMEVFSFLTVSEIAKSGIYRITKLDKEKFANWHHQRILELRIYPGRIMFEHNTVKGLVSFGNELIQWSFQFAQKRISILIADRLYKETQI